MQPHPIYSVSPSFKNRTVRDGDWKLVVNGSGAAEKRELYNIRSDVGETKNVIAEQPARAKELDALLVKFAADDKPAKTGGKGD